MAIYNLRTRRVNTSGFLAGARKSMTANTAVTTTNSASITQFATFSRRARSLINSAKNTGKYQLRIAPPRPTSTQFFKSRSRLRLIQRR